MKKEIKTFTVTDGDGNNIECCAAIDEENNIFIYAKDKHGWDDYEDGTTNPGPGVFVPDGYVVVNCGQSKPVVDALIRIGILDEPEPAFRIKSNHIMLDVCRLNPDKAAEWNAYDALFAE